MAVDLYAACFPGAILFMLKSGKVITSVIHLLRLYLISDDKELMIISGADHTDFFDDFP